MKLKLPKIKISQSFFSPIYIYIIIFGLTFATIAVLSWFLYRNLYQTITQSEQIILLKQEVAPDTIDIKTVEEVLKALDQKTAPADGIDWQKIKNLFNPIAASPAVSSPIPTPTQ